MGKSADGAAISGLSNPAGLSTRTLAWLAGRIAMIALIATAAMLTLSPAMEAPPAEPTAQAEATQLSAEDARSEAAALEWLALTDAGEWEESWEAAADMFQSEVTAAQIGRSGNRCARSAWRCCLSRGSHHSADCRAARRARRRLYGHPVCHCFCGISRIGGNRHHARRRRGAENRRLFHPIKCARAGFKAPPVTYAAMCLYTARWWLNSLKPQ